MPIINVVYEHLQGQGLIAHLADATVIWTAEPLETADVYAYFNAHSYRLRTRGVSVLLLHEPITVLPGQYSRQVWQYFDYILTPYDVLAERGGSFVKSPLPAFDGPLMSSPKKEIDLSYATPFATRRNAICLIAGNKASGIPGENYSRRAGYARWFYDRSDIPFDVYGRPPFDLPNYRGALEPFSRKLETLGKYRYALTLENTYHPVWSRGYVSEKLLDAFCCQTVPIYLGCYNIEDYVPLDCFIDGRQFKGPPDLDRFLHQITDDQYLSYQQHIREWVGAGHLESYSTYRSYDQLAAIAQNTGRYNDLPITHWEPGPAREHEGRPWAVAIRPAVWGYNELASYMPSRALLSGDLDASPECSTGKSAGSERPAAGTLEAQSNANRWVCGSWQLRQINEATGLIEVNGVPGFLNPADMKYLLNKAASLPKGAKIVEIGSYMGLSSIIMAYGLRVSGNQSARIYCVDPWDDAYMGRVGVTSHSSLYGAFMKHIADAGVTDAIVPVRSLSLDAAVQFEDRSVDLVFVDGDHSFEGCTADLETWRAKIRPGGHLAGHDCRPNDDVRRAVDSFSRQCGLQWRMVDAGHNSSIFEMQLPRATSHPTVVTSEVTSIVILNYNGLDRLKPCLESIDRHTPEPHELVVVDNASTDGSREYLRARRGLLLLENATNLGCPPARAQALALATGDFIVSLDNDTIVTPGWLSRLLSHARNNPRIGILGPRSNFVSGPQLVPGASYRDVAQLDQYARAWADQHKGSLTRAHRLVGFCQFIRRQVIEKIGVTEPRFGFGFDDDDYTLRANIAGFETAIADDVFIHHTGGPQGRGDAEYNRRLFADWEVFKSKWGLPLGLPYGAGYDLGRLLRQPYDRDRHFIVPPDRQTLEGLIYCRERDTTTAGTLEHAERLVKSGDLAGAVAELQRVSCEHADLPGAQAALGATLMALDRFDEALPALRKAIELQPDDANLHNQLGVALFRLGETAGAEDAFRQAKQAAPRDVQPLLNLIGLYRSRKQYVEATQEVKEAMTLDNNHPEVLFALGVLGVEIGNTECAQRALNRLAQVQPEHRGIRALRKGLEGMNSVANSAASNQAG
jgi:GT2 family glycosyltransferase/Flp pilus assembly protein TadD/predicted O-methyltransferase YrrM